MRDEILASRARVSRRRLLAVGGSIGVGTLLAACGDDAGTGAAPSATATVTTPEGTNATISPSTPASGSLVALLDEATTCSLTKEETQGPYWFDVDSIRSDVREDRPGTRLELALRVQDLANCKPDGSPGAVPSAVVELWHCDAGGSYSGFESGSAGANGGPPGGGGGAPPDGGGGAPPGGGGPPSGGGGGAPGAAGGTVADGSYAKGDVEAATTDDATYLRGAQVTDRDGIVHFTTVYPGWYRGRTVHIHLKVHVDKRTVLTTQLFFDEAVNSEAFKATPYSAHTGRDTFNDGDSIYDASGLATTRKAEGGYEAALNLGVDLT